MKHTKLIEKYLQNKASAEELKEINRLLKEDAAFKANLYFHINLREAVRREEGKLLKEQLKSLGKQKKNGAFFSGDLENSSRICHWFGHPLVL